MLELMRDSLWEFVGVVIALVAIFISILTIVIQRKRKAFSYEVMTETSLLSVAHEVEEKVQVTFEGEVVRKVHLILVKLTNSGNVPILPTDYIKNVSLCFAGDKVLSTEVLETAPDSVEAVIEAKGSRVVLNPTLLNSGDSITVKALVSEHDGKINVEGRIVGVKEIKPRRTELSTSTIVMVFLGLMVLLVGVVGGFVTNYPVFTAIATIGVVLSLFPASTDRKYRKILASGVEIGIRTVGIMTRALFEEISRPN